MLGTGEGDGEETTFVARRDGGNPAAVMSQDGGQDGGQKVQRLRLVQLPFERRKEGESVAE